MNDFLFCTSHLSNGTYATVQDDPRDKNNTQKSMAGISNLWEIIFNPIGSSIGCCSCNIGKQLGRWALVDDAASTPERGGGAGLGGGK